MKKKCYSKPTIVAEKFEPQNFVAACAQPTHWTAKCRDVSCLIFFMDGDWKSDANRGGCGKTHTFVLENGMKPEANCWLLLNVRSRQPGEVNGNSYPYRNWFTTRGGSDGVGWVLDPDMVTSLKASGELVEGYYNAQLLGENSWLVTDDIANIKNPS